MGKGRPGTCTCTPACVSHRAGPPSLSPNPRPPGHRASQGAPGCRHPRVPGRAAGVTPQIAKCQWPAPPSVSSHHGDAPKCCEFGASSFFLFLLLPFAFPPIFMRRVSIYPDTSSPLWVSAGRAQTTNPRRYFPQSSIWLGWQAPRAACWELAEADRGGAAGRQPRGAPTPAPGAGLWDAQWVGPGISGEH